MKAGRNILTILSLLLFLVSVQAGLAIADDLSTVQPTSVHCYFGNPGDNEVVGTIDIPYPSSATTTCNTVFIDCKNKCTGCYFNHDLDEICN